MPIDSNTPFNSGSENSKPTMADLEESYKEIDRDFFDQVYSSLGNNDGKLRMIDGSNSKIRYYILTRFLLE